MGSCWPRVVVLETGPAATPGGGGGLRSAGVAVRRCLSDLGGQPDLWADVDARTTVGGSVGALVGRIRSCGTVSRTHKMRGTIAWPQSWTSYQWLTGRLKLSAVSRIESRRSAVSANNTYHGFHYPEGTTRTLDVTRK